MQFHYVSLLALAAAPVLGLPRGNVTACKATPGDAGWPSPEAWAQLNETTGGHLLRPTPPGAVCHPTQPVFAEDQCSKIQSSWFDEFFHADDPVSVEWNNWNNDTCLANSNFPCSTTGYPVYVVNATTPQHVKAGVDFAREHNIRLIVKNSGHDYVGRSSAPYALSIWVHHMDSVQLHEKSFTPKNCSVKIDGAAITAGAGTQMVNALKAADSVNHTVVGGNGRTVALGGFITGGGHSILAPRFGLATDQVLEMEAVTPTGQILTLNECQNTDLFWAMRGGGGSTFGVLTSVTLKMHPSPSITNMNWWATMKANDSRAFDMITYLVSNFPSLGDAGVSGYPLIYNSVPDSLTGKDLITGIGGLFLMTDTNATQMTRLLAPHFYHINDTWPGVAIFANITQYASVNEWFSHNYDPSPSGLDLVMGSRLLDKQALTGNITALKSGLQKFSKGDQTTVFIVSGKGVHDAQPRGGSNAILPAWRKTYVHATTSIFFSPHNETAKAAAIDSTKSYASSLRQLAPGTGAYMNEASRYEPNWQQTFWGSNYERLLKIKRLVDPDDVFWCHPCVGNERWQEADNKLCRV